MIGIARLHTLFRIDADLGDLIWLNPPENHAWNHKRRRKASPCPMGVRQIPSGRFVARIAATLGTFDTVDEARAAYLAARSTLFGEFA